MHQASRTFYSGSILDAVRKAVETIQGRWSSKPRTGIILGTGLGDLTEHVNVELDVPFGELEGFPTSTALSHRGRFVCGTLADVPVILVDGRCHYYEGHSFETLTLPIQVLAGLGIEAAIVSNASGGLNPFFDNGDIMIVEDHINLLWGKPGEQLANQRPVYDRELQHVALEAARQQDFAAHLGVYVAMTGPTYETRAEYRFLRKIGGDAVGMSTVPEVIVGHSAGLRVFAVSVISNVARPDAPHEVSAEQVVAAAASAEPKLRHIVQTIVQHVG